MALTLPRRNYVEAYDLLEEANEIENLGDGRATSP